MGRCKNKWQIGTWVRVKAVVSFGYDGKKNRVVFRSEVKPFEAQIVGAVSRKLGEYNEGSTGRGSWGIEPPDPEPPYLAVSSSVFVLRVTRGLMNKPDDVLPEDVEVICVWASQKTPLLASLSGPPDDRVRKELSEAAKGQHRSGGRFAKMGVVR